MLVVADKGTASIGRQCGLAGARKAEEDRAFAVGADVCRTVHRHHALRGKQVVQQTEHPLLHLARIFGAADQDQLFGEVDRDDRVAAAAVSRRVSFEAGKVDDGVFRNEAGQLISRRAHQQGPDEQIVPCHLVDDPHVHAVFRLRSAEKIGDVEFFLRSKRGHDIGLQICPMLRGHRLVDRAPVDRLLGGRIADDILVLHAASGELTCVDQQRAVLGQLALAALDRFLDQGCRREVPVDGRVRGDALGV